MVVLKIKFGEDTRRVSFEGASTYASLVTLLKQIFPNLPNNFRVKYLDDDQDLVTISTDIELKEAISVAEGNKVLRLFIHVDGSKPEQPQPQTQPQSHSMEEGAQKSEQASSQIPPFNPFANWQELFGNSHINPQFFEQLGNRMSNAADNVESDLNKMFKNLGISGEGKKVPSVQEIQQNVEGLMNQMAENPFVKEYFSQFLAALSKMQQQVTNAANEAARAANAHFSGKEESSEPVIHPNVICDGCDSPIRGIRYKCSICANYDLCEACEAQGNLHDSSHPLLKISRPIHGRPCRRPFHRWSSWIPKNPVPFERGTGDASRPLGRFVCDVSIEDGTIFPPSEKFVKIWRLRNEGSSAWPETTRLSFVGGDRLSSSEAVVVGGVNPGAEIDVDIEMTSPSRPGRYIGYYRLTLPDGSRFGQRVWVDIIVAEKTEKADQASQVEENSTKKADQASQVEQNQTEQADQASQVEQFSQMDEATQAMEEEEVEPEPELSAELQQLRDMGFCDMKKNIYLLQKYNNDVLLVVQDLLIA